MNLAIVIGFFHPRGSGVERSTSQIVSELVSRGHKVTVITAYSPDHIVVPGATIDRCSVTGRGAKWPWRTIRFARWARRRLSEGRFDASISVTTAVPAMLVQPLSGTLREAHQRRIAIQRGGRARWSKRLLLKLSVKQQILLALERQTLTDPTVRLILPGSRYVADQLWRQYQIDRGRMRVVPQAAQMPCVGDEQRQSWRDRVRRGFNIPDLSTVYLFAALNPRLKGVNPLLAATRQLLDKGVELTLLLAGKMGYAQQHLAAELGIRDRVRMVATTDQMAQLYAAADVTVHPTFYDPSSRVVIESLMMGTPVISTSFNGSSDLILGPAGQPRCGRVIETPADVDALAQAMVELADPVQRQQCVAAMNGLADSLSMKRHVDQLEEVMMEMADPGR